MSPSLRRASIILLGALAMGAGCPSGPEEEAPVGVSNTPPGAETAREPAADRAAADDQDEQRDETAAAAEPEVPPDLPLAVETPPAELSAAVLAHVHEVVRAHPDRRADLFAKIGGSSTVNRGFLHCFASDRVDLGEHAALSATLDYYGRGQDGPFARSSESTGVGWTTPFLLMGRPPAYLREVETLSPRWALLLVGGNDTPGEDPIGFARRTSFMIRSLLERGTMPVLGTVLPRRYREADQWVRRYNEMLQALAVAWRLPIVDYYGALDAIPDRGLAADGMHPNAYRSLWTHACVLDAAGLQYGNNLRNLLTLRMLEQLRQSLHVEAPAASAASPGEGTEASPYRITRVPFGRRATGPAVYRFILDAEMSLRATVVADARAETSITLIRDGDAAPIGPFDHSLMRRLEPGTYRVQVAAPSDQEHLFALTTEPTR